MIRLAALLLALQSCAPVMAAEIAGVDTDQPDKRAHAIAGGLIASTVIAIENRFAADCPWWLKATIPIACASAAGIAKEYLWDARRGGDVDVRDARATVAGGCAITLCLTWTF